MSKIPSTETIKNELNQAMSKYGFTVNYLSVASNSDTGSDDVAIGVVFTECEVQENDK